MSIFKKNLILLVFLLVFACSDNGVNIQIDNEFKYPLLVGNSWSYKTIYDNFNFRMDDDTYDTTSIIQHVESDEFANVIGNVRLENGINTLHLQTHSNSPTYNSTSDYYLTNTDSGLCHIAYLARGGGIIVPKENNVINYLFNGRKYSSIDEMFSEYKNAELSLRKVKSDSIIYEPKPLISIKYPVVLGEQWYFRAKDSFPFTITKKFIGRELIETAIGEFNCYKIQWLYDMDEDGKWDDNINFIDYISEKGLMKRTIFFKDILISNTARPDGVGLVDSKQEMNLVHINF